MTNSIILCKEKQMYIAMRVDGRLYNWAYPHGPLFGYSAQSIGITLAGHHHCAPVGLYLFQIDYNTSFIKPNTFSSDKTNFLYRSKTVVIVRSHQLTVKSKS
jgi:hypothetical protein